MAELKRNTASKIGMRVLYFAIAALCVCLDQGSKFLALHHLPLGKARPFIPGFLEFLRIENRGAAFGVLQGQMFFFFVITAVILLLILYVLHRLPAERRYLLFVANLAYLTGGSLGNLWHRLTRDSVVDYLSFIPISFPVFNVADIFVTGSAFAFVLLFCFYYKEEEFTFLR